MCNRRVIDENSLHNNPTGERMMKKICLSLPLFYLLLLPGHCLADKPLACFVSILPQAYFVERIARTGAVVTTLVAPGQSPHTFEPTPKQLTALSGADLYFTTGLPFEERLLEKIAGIAPHLKVVDTTRSIDTMALSTDCGHDHGDKDPHIWLDPKLAMVQAETIAAALIELIPEQQRYFTENLGLLKSDLKQLDRDISAMLTPFKARRIYVFHPAYGYFARAYRLVQVAIESEGKEPGARHLAQVIKQAQADRIRTVFSEIQYSPRSAQTIADQIGARVVMLDPLAKDYTANLLHIARQIRKSFSDDE